MRINLAKVVPFLGLVVVFLFWAAAQSTGTDDSPGAGYDYGYDTPDTPDTSRADAYFDRVATELAQPGVYVDPAVTEISATEAARLDAIAQETAGPVRVLVVPADALRELDPERPRRGVRQRPLLRRRRAARPALRPGRRRRHLRRAGRRGVVI